MKISVLTACRNAAETIGYTLDSFVAQTYPHKEMVIVDGASNDRTLDIVRSYRHEHIHLVSEADAGMYHALNKALSLHTGRAVGVLNADDAYHDETTLERIAAALAHADIVHGHVNFVQDHESKVVVRRWRATHRPRHGFRTGWMPAHPTFYVRREVAERVGGFDTSFKTAADYDWMLRAVELADHSMALVDRVIVDMRQGGRSTAGLMAHIVHNLEAQRSRQRWLDAGLVDLALLAKPMRKIRQFV